MNNCINKKIFYFLGFILPCFFILLFFSYDLYCGGDMLFDSTYNTLKIYFVGIIVTGIFLLKNHYWFSIFMIIAGLYLAVCDRSIYTFFGEIISLYGCYLVVHFAFCFLYTYLAKTQNMKDALPFFIFIYPSYFILAIFAFGLLEIGKALWYELNVMFLLALFLGAIFTGISLIKRKYWGSILMVALGVYLIATKQNNNIIPLTSALYGYYLILHFFICSLFVNPRK